MAGQRNHSWTTRHLSPNVLASRASPEANAGVSSLELTVAGLNGSERAVTRSLGFVTALAVSPRVARVSECQERRMAAASCCGIPRGGDPTVVCISSMKRPSIPTLAHYGQDQGRAAATRKGATWGNQWIPHASRAPENREATPESILMPRIPHGPSGTSRISLSAVPETDAHPSLPE